MSHLVPYLENPAHGFREMSKHPAPARGAKGQWVDPVAATALTWLILQSRKAQRTGAVLPGHIYSDIVAPFLRLEGPQPNQLYAIGGRDQQQEPLSTVEMFDTWDGRWVQCPSMLVRRAGCAASALPDGRLLVIGGYDQRGIVEGLLATGEVFDPVTHQWSEAYAKLRRARWGHGCASLGGKIYVVGGCSLRPWAPPREASMETLRSCELFDPVVGSWNQFGDLTVPRAGARVVSLGCRYLAAVGGCDDVFGRADLLKTVELFDLQTGLWAMLGPQLSTPRTTAAVAAIDDRRILVVGGAPSLSSVEVYKVMSDLEQRPLEEGPPRPKLGDMKEGRMGCQAAAMSLPAPGQTFPLCTRTCVVVVGGENGEPEWDDHVRQFPDVLVFDVEADTWRHPDFIPAIPTPRTAMALCVSPGMVRHELPTMVLETLVSPL